MGAFGRTADMEEVTGSLEKLAAALQYAQKLRTGVLSNDTPWMEWHDKIFGEQRAPFGPHHIEFWDWVEGIKLGVRSEPFAAFWSRGGAKSTSVERAVVFLGATNRRRYILYVSATQEQADKHVESIASMMESDTIQKYYPEFGRRLVGKYGNSRGWRRNRLRTADGFTVDALGLDVAGRGIRVDDQRPDGIVLDDIDEETDSNVLIEKKIRTLTTKVLPSGSHDMISFFVQNIIHSGSIASKMVNFQIDMLSDRIISGPFKALNNFSYVEEQQPDGRIIYRITSGIPTWEGQNVAVCQHYINTFGLRAFLTECQHEVDDVEGGMFAHINFIHVQESEVPELIRSEVWVDPAVSSTDKSDSHGISAGGVDIDNNLYRLYSWEGISTPGASIRRAIELAIQIGADAVGVETDQGGDLWEETYRLIAAEFERDRGILAPKFKSEKAGSGYGSKAHRVALMVPAYERGEIRHVINSSGHHVILERALKRFPLAKPFDLVDASWHLWNSLVGVKQPGFGVSVNGQSHFATIIPIRSSLDEKPFAPVLEQGRIRGIR